jgi:hypothetical protein
MKRPQRKIMGKRKKLEKVCASNISFTDTAIKRPRRVEVTAIRKTAPSVESQWMPDKLVRKEAKSTGTKALIMPKRMAPLVFASIRKFRSRGANRSLSKERLLLSKVMVTASIEVVPKRMDRLITPGRSSRTFTAVCDFKKNISVQATGKTNPQLIFGGFR